MPSLTAQPVPLNIRPGINKNLTALQARDQYVDGDKVRFKEGRAQKLSGWARAPVSGTFLGVCRNTLTWQALDRNKLQASGTHNHLYINSGGRYYDITPLRTNASYVDPLTTTSGLSTVTITIAAHGCAVNDYIFFPSSVTYNGITFSGEYLVTSVTDVNNFVIDTGTNASGSGTGGGSVTIQTYIDSGLADTGIGGLGWGAGTYGTSTYGTPRATGLIEDARVWCLDNWGEDLLSLPIGGALYFWDTSVGVSSRATQVTTAPARSNFMLVASRFRQCILFGTETVSSVYDPMLIRWSDAEDYTEFNPAPTNSAGEYRLTKGTKIVSALETRDGEILVWTDTSVYRMRPVETDEIYQVDIVGASVGIIAPLARVNAEAVTFWMAPSGWHVYDGVVRKYPTTLDGFYFQNTSDGFYNEGQKVKIIMGLDQLYSEVWVHLPDKNNIENNRYVCLNYKENIAYDGTMQRTAWSDSVAFDTPLAYNRAGTLYAHNVGVDDDGAPMNSYITSAFYDISDSDFMMLVDRFSLEGLFNGLHTLTLTAKKYIQDDYTSTKTYNFTNTTPFIPVRSEGRFVSFTITSNQVAGDYRLGQLFASVVRAGKR